MKKDSVSTLLDDIERILQRDGRTIADLAKDIKLTDPRTGKERTCSYHQMYLWVRARRFNPRAEPLIKLQQWRDKHA
jgi:hypothetical protein